MINSRLPFRAARPSRGGFTLVELLVVIGIIAILAGVALGPITSGLKKAKQSSCMQSSHALYLASFSYSNDHNQVYADGADASKIAIALLAGSYVNDASIFWISGDQGSGAAQYTGQTPLTGLTQNNISWDFLGNTLNGVDTTFGDYCPIVWSTLYGSEPTVNSVAANAALTATPLATNPLGTAGIAIAYKSGSSAFVASTYTTAYTVTMVTSASNTNGTPATATVVAGK
jgi:prepilin-type N-terminal cleavage/methylation domain-containing protein